MKDALKQRLVGAVVLAALAVIFLPGFFREQKAPDVDIATQIPPQPGVPHVDFEVPQPDADIQPAPDPETMFLSAEDESGAEQSPVPGQNPEPDFPNQGPSAESLPKSELPVPGVVGSSVDTQDTASKTPEPSTPAPESVPDLPLGADGIPAAWVVQVASLGNLQAATKLRDELQTEGHKAYVRTVTTPNGKVTRVFIGPKLDKAEALAIKAKVDQRLKIKSLVRRFEP